MDSVLLNIESETGRLLGITHEMTGVIRDIKAILAGKGDNVPKFRLYSAHDTNIANWLVQFNPSYDWFGIPYAANIHIEMWQDNSNNNFFKFVYNGVAHKLESCATSLCTEAEFLQHLKRQTYQGDLEAACAKDPTFNKVVIMKEEETKFLS